MRRVGTTEMVEAALNTLLVAGALSVSLVAPNATQLFGKALIKRLDKSTAQRESKRLLRYMKAKGYIEITDTSDDTVTVTLTNDGRARSSKLNLQHLQINRPKRWDGMWRVVSYDIPNKNRAASSALSSRLKSLGMLQLQRSMWVYPFPCEHEIRALTETYGISRYVSYMEVRYIDSHNKLVQDFSNLFV